MQLNSYQKELRKQNTLSHFQAEDCGDTVYRHLNWHSGILVVEIPLIIAFVFFNAFALDRDVPKDVANLVFFDHVHYIFGSFFTFLSFRLIRNMVCQIKKLKISVRQLFWRFFVFHYVFVDNNFEIFGHQKLDDWNMIVCDILQDLRLNLFNLRVDLDEVLVDHDVICFDDWVQK